MGSKDKLTLRRTFVCCQVYKCQKALYGIENVGYRDSKE